MMDFDSLICAELIWDGGEVAIPSGFEAPSPNQMRGTAHDRLGEVACRTCYDSCGVDPRTGKQKGRSSAQLHEHILEVKNHNVYEHADFTVRIEKVPHDILLHCFINRPGVWCELTHEGFEVSMNHRCVLEWDRWEPSFAHSYGSIIQCLGRKLWNHARKLAPQIYPGPKNLLSEECRLVPKTKDLLSTQASISLYLSFSRGCGNEQCRHRFRMSQRCISGDMQLTFVRMSEDGEVAKIKWRKEKTIRDLYMTYMNPTYRTNLERICVRVLNEETGFFEGGLVKEVIFSGVKPCFRVTLENDKYIDCTTDHRLWTDGGWKTLGDIAHPVVVGNGVTAWDKENASLVGSNGTSVAGLGLYRDPEWLMTRYWTENKKLKEMAEECGCSVAVIRTWLRKHGLQREMHEINEGRTPWNKGIEYSHSKPYSPESIERYRQSKLGDKNPMWKGGKGSAERGEFQAWKKKHRHEIMERDGFRCKKCGRHGSEVPAPTYSFRKRKIEIHHIIPLWNRPDLNLDPNNMATLCWECHVSICGRELEFAEFLQKAIESPVIYTPSDRKIQKSKRRIRVHYQKIKSITFVGDIDTYDLVLEGPNHGFVGNGIVVHNSTRYVDESESPYVRHPLITQFLSDDTVDGFIKQDALARMKISETNDKSTYDHLVTALQSYLKNKGVEGTQARKQARGAARGSLGLALHTEMIFTAPVSGWQWILSQRANKLADAEIRVLYATGDKSVLSCLKKSRYGHFFKDFQVEDCQDGMGKSLV